MMKNQVREKKLKTVDKKIQDGLANIRRILNLPSKSKKSTSDKAATATSDIALSGTPSKPTAEIATASKRTAPTVSSSKPAAAIASRRTALTATVSKPSTATASRPTALTATAAKSTATTAPSRPTAQTATSSKPNATTPTLSTPTGSKSTAIPSKDTGQKLLIPTKTYGQKEVANHSKAQDEFKLPIPTKEFLERRKKKGKCKEKHLI